MRTQTVRWQGLRVLLQDAVEHGSRAIERVQKRTAARTFDVLEAIPLVSEPAHLVRLFHDGMVTGVHAAIRLTSRGVGEIARLALDVVEHNEAMAQNHRREAIKASVVTVPLTLPAGIASPSRAARVARNASTCGPRSPGDE